MNKSMNSHLPRMVPNSGNVGGAHVEPGKPGLDELFPGATNPFPWMAEMIDLKKEKNFFETRVIEYQTGGALSWD